MKILFTGASSFTGYWFIQELVKNGHTVHAICQKNRSEYEGIRKQRLDKIHSLCETYFDCPFGSNTFLHLLEKNSFDLLCHHAADVFNYKSVDFDCIRALDNNAKNLSLVLQRLEANGCKRIVLTGTIFEPREGGSPDAKAMSPYGLSKGLTGQVFEAYAEARNMRLGRFIIPNPFGPYEEFRYTSYLMQSWVQGKTPIVTSPVYVRDNIHVDLLAKAYRIFAETLGPDGDVAFFRPSGYIETQAAFTRRFSEEMEKRLFLPCPFELKEQTEFPEPMLRINSDRLNPKVYNWEEQNAWDVLANYYEQAFR